MNAPHLHSITNKTWIQALFFLTSVKIMFFHRFFHRFFHIVFHSYFTTISRKVKALTYPTDLQNKEKVPRAMPGLWGRYYPYPYPYPYSYPPPPPPPPLPSALSPPLCPRSVPCSTIALLLSPPIIINYVVICILEHIFHFFMSTFRPRIDKKCPIFYKWIFCCFFSRPLFGAYKLKRLMSIYRHHKMGKMSKYPLQNQSNRV